jgi:tRNA pseudouridine38-40 synthase
MARFKVYLEYEGTRYSGWQIQKNARTVQGEIIRAMRNVFQTEKLELMGAGRTDAGVHALLQVAHLDVQTMLAPEIICMKVNDELPADINIIEVEKASPAFHARHDAVARSYLYQISRRRTAFGKRYVWWTKDALNVHAMQDVARLLVGMRNFQSFTDDDPDEKSTSVLIEEITISEAGDLLLIRIVGSHFLWKLVRRIVGVLAEAGRGKLSQHDVAQLLHEPSDAPARLTAPPSGLFLERVYYRGDKRLGSLAPVMGVDAKSELLGKHRR